MNSKPTQPDAQAGAPWNPMLPWIDLGMRALDISMGMTQSWQQWMAGVGTLIAAGQGRDETPRSAIPVRRALTEHAVARENTPAASPKRPPARTRAKAKARKSPRS